VPGNTIALTSLPGLLGAAVFVITIAFSALALANLLPRLRRRRPR
jgi:hypothetical protein